MMKISLKVLFLCLCLGFQVQAQELEILSLQDKILGCAQVGENLFANNQFVLDGNRLLLSHATMQLNGVVLKMDLDSGNYVGSTDEITLEIKNCKFLNPVLINRVFN